MNHKLGKAAAALTSFWQMRKLQLEDSWTCLSLGSTAASGPGFFFLYISNELPENSVPSSPLVNFFPGSVPPSITWRIHLSSFLPSRWKPKSCEPIRREGPKVCLCEWVSSQGSGPGKVKRSEVMHDVLTPFQSRLPHPDSTPRRNCN